MKQFLFLLLFTFSFVGSNAQQIDTLAEGYTCFRYPGGQKSSEGIIRDNKPDGYWKAYYADGKVKSEGNRKNFKLDGVWAFFNSRGDTTEIINYRNDKKNGYQYNYKWNYKDNEKTGGLVSKELFMNDKLQNKSYYYKNGVLFQVINYKNNEKHGKAFEYHPDGRITDEIQYRKRIITKRTKVNRYDKDTLKQGLWREYHSNDRVKMEANYVDGQLHGYYREFDIRGQLKRNIRYNHGVEIEQSESESDDVEEVVEYHPNGRIKSKGGFLDKKPVGVHRKYNQKGELETAEIFDDEGNRVGEGIVEETGRRKGNWRSYYETGELKSEGTYKKGRKTGKWTYYFRNGKTEQLGNFRNGKLSGEWQWYYPSGELWRVEKFMNGREEGESIEYSREGGIISQGEYVDGLKEGEWVSSYGDHFEKGVYNQGEREGKWKFYFLNENLKFEGNFIQGKEDGKHRWYYETGKLKEERYFVYGSRERMWKFFNTDGTLRMTVTYRNDKEYKVNGKKIDDDIE